MGNRNMDDALVVFMVLVMCFVLCALSFAVLNALWHVSFTPVSTKHFLAEFITLYNSTSEIIFGIFTPNS